MVASRLACLILSPPKEESVLFVHEDEALARVDKLIEEGAHVIGAVRKGETGLLSLMPLRHNGSEATLRAMLDTTLPGTIAIVYRKYDGWYAWAAAPKDPT